MRGKIAIVDGIGCREELRAKIYNLFPSDQEGHITMENAYGIGVKNRYDLFYNEDVDPFEILKQQELEKERRKSEKGQTKEKAKGTKPGKPIAPAGQTKKPKESTPAPVTKPAESTETPPKTRNRPFGDRPNKPQAPFDENKEHEEKKNFRNREEQPFTSDPRERGDGEFRRGRGGFRGRGRGRGRGGFSSFDGGRPRREFDRHSGSDRTGVRSVDKREGGGPNNWGNAKDDFLIASSKRETSSWADARDDFDQSPEKRTADESTTWGEEINQEFDVQPTTVQNEETVEKTSEETVQENTESKENVPVTDEATEEAMREMTLDEWKREQESKRAKPKYNLRKPGEGEDSSQWKKLYMLKKKAKEDEEEEEEEEEDADDEEFGRRGRQRQLVDIQIKFNDSQRGRGRGRMSRGGPRSSGGMGSRGPGREDRNQDTAGSGNTGGMGGGRGMNRGPPKIKSPQQSAPRVDDWNDFPSLVTA